MTKTETIDVPEVIELLERAVAEKGADYIYPEELRSGKACVYALEDGSPACIVGYVLSYKNLLSRLIAPDNEGETPYYQNDNVAGIARLFIPELTDNAVYILQGAQGAQDRCGTWGEALDVAKVRAQENA